MALFTRAILSAAIAGVAIASVAHAQQVKQLTVPGVTVTAPAVPTQPPYIAGDPWKAYARNPYFGRYRVEENRFARVPCAQTRVAAAAGGSCLLGYRLTTGGAYMKSAGGSHCDMAMDVVTYTSGEVSVEASIVIFDPYKVTAIGYPDSNCYVHPYPDYDLVDFADMNQVTRRGGNWHDLQSDGDDKSAAFSDGPHACAAVRRHGPRWSGGYVYMLTASICRSDAAALQPQDIARGIAAIQIRQYDPNGNINRPRQ